jgi:leucyl-tRNA synthetase
MRERYDFERIEEKWLPRWESDRAWAAPRVPTRGKRYVLEMYPYPSGDMHMGHVENFAGIGDTIARYWRMQGFDVLHPFGYDAFGLPAENAAISRGVHPRDWTYANIEKFTQSCKKLAISYDWDRAVNTCDPHYYRWNQWLFLRLLERDLAYRREAKVNWCPVDRTVLANEQISAGVCWRCGSVPEVRDLEQWFFRTTAYAQELLDGMDELQWSERVLAQQRNWIGRSDGARVGFDVAGRDVEVFTTRPDTLWGVTFFVFAPEHPIAADLAAAAGLSEEYRRFLEDVRRQTDIDRVALQAQRRAFDLRASARNPVNGEEIPVFAADYVLMGYGTGAIMGVPAHDQRDFEFARQLGLAIRVVIAPEDEELDPDAMTQAYEGEGVMVSSGPFNGTPSRAGAAGSDVREAVATVTQWLESEGLGNAETHYRLRDWLISRQRYWGTPIPVVYCDRCGMVPVPDEQLPVTLPDVVDYQPTGGATSPLATASEWVRAKCPSCGDEGRRETDTMDTFVDSSWYFLRFCDPRNESTPFERDLADAWMPVDQYTGGIEHAVMHLIYARFMTRVLHDMGLLGAREPFVRLMNQGVIKKDGKMMSKSLGNVVEPQEVLDRFGADALRLFILFIGPPTEDYDWPPEGADAVRGAHRYLERVWRLVDDILAAAPGSVSGSSDLRRTIHRTLAAVTTDFDRFAFNTAIAKLMELTNALSDAARGGAPAAELREGASVLVQCLAPIAPYITEELWERLAGSGSVHASEWPQADTALSRVDRVTMVVQVDSKVRDRLEVPADIGEDDAIAASLRSERVLQALGGREPARVIARPPRLINILSS